MRKLFSFPALLLAVFLLAAGAGTVFLPAPQSMTQDSIYCALDDISVRIDVSDGAHGSGVLVTRQVGDVTRTYVWTAGHVVKFLQQSDGTFANATIYREYRDGGLYAYKATVRAKVIAYSAPEVEDLALLEILEDNYQPLCVSATFYEPVSPVGTPLIHVGSTLALYNSLSLGVISQTDRQMDGTNFDQTSVMGYPGSSGGGVYLTNGKCVGLLTRGCGAGLNFIVPARRMRVWANKVGIAWAMDTGVKVPLVRAPTSLESTPPAPKSDGIIIIRCPGSHTFDPVFPSVRPY